jgi:hypothetical protein
MSVTLVDKKKDIIGLSNLSSDIIVDVPEEFIKIKNFKKELRIKKQEWSNWNSRG